MASESSGFRPRTPELLPCVAMPDARHPQNPNRSPAGAPRSPSLRHLPRPKAIPSANNQSLEFSARGESVNARVLTPLSGDPPYPLTIFIHDEVDGIGLPATSRCFEAGAAVIDVNWPLTGIRRSPKMSLQVLAALNRRDENRGDSLLLHQFVTQAEEEFACLLAAAADIPELDAETILRLDLCFTPERTRVADERHELFAPRGPARSSLSEDLKVGIAPAQARRALGEFLMALLD